MAQPFYTSSRLYVLPLKQFQRTFFRASHEPRYVCGLRVFCSDEIARNPDKMSQRPQDVAKIMGVVSLVDAVTMMPYVKGLPLNTLSNNFISAASKNASGNPQNGFGTGPVVRPLRPTNRTDLAASWIYCPQKIASNTAFVFIEIFYNDEWPRSRSI